jgi:hypothetical protein
MVANAQAHTSGVDRSWGSPKLEQSQVSRKTVGITRESCAPKAYPSSAVGGLPGRRCHSGTYTIISTVAAQNVEINPDVLKSGRHR